ncbi:MAG: lysophospholipid acyltransferase family protein [Acidobacteriota bacterium]
MAVPIDPLTSEDPQGRTATQRIDGERRSSRRASRPRASASLEDLRNRVYRFSNLSPYGTRDRWIIRAADGFFYLLICLICSTLRWEVRGREHLDSILSGGHRPIFTSWHACILSATWFWRNRGIVVMSSTSRDAEYTGRVIKRFGYGTARGSSTRGGGRALAEMAECLHNGIEAGFTIDGPRGPAYVAKPGAVTLARHTGQAILPFHIAASKCIELPTWDRLQIPWPFARAVALIAKPIYVGRDSSGEEVARKQAAVQSALDNLRREAESWRRRGKEQRAKGKGRSAKS